MSGPLMGLHAFWSNLRYNGTPTTRKRHRIRNYFLFFGLIVRKQRVHTYHTAIYADFVTSPDRQAKWSEKCLTNHRGSSVWWGLHPATHVGGMLFTCPVSQDFAHFWSCQQATAGVYLSDTLSLRMCSNSGYACVCYLCLLYHDYRAL